MIKTNPNSRLAIWSGGYIQNVEERNESDKNVDILQIEQGTSSGYYIVEIIEIDS